MSRYKLWSKRDATNKKNSHGSDDSPDAGDVTVVININEVQTQIRTQPIGGGLHSIVYEGHWRTPNTLERVAVKIQRESATVDRLLQLQQFLKEASVMSQLKHPHIIRLHGVVLHPVKLIMEFASMGNLLSYLKVPDNIFTTKRLHNYAKQIADAMDFLSQRRIVYCNLMAKSILVCRNDCVKVSGFKMAGYLDNIGIFKSDIPVSPDTAAWSSLEILQQGIYSTASDVWSYGITIWEIYSLGEPPWEGLNPTEITDNHLANKLLPKPKRCHQLAYSIMQQCWKISPEQRTSFHKILDVLNEIVYEEVLAITECNVDDDTDNENLGYKTGDRIVVIDKHTDTWWTGIHTVNGKCGWFLTNNVHRDAAPLATLKCDIKTRKKRVENITIGLPTNIMHQAHIGKDGSRWHNQPISADFFKKKSRANPISSVVKRAASVPLSTENSTTETSSAAKLNKGAKFDTLPVHNLQLYSNQVSSSCPDVTHAVKINISPEDEISEPNYANQFTSSCPDISSHAITTATFKPHLESNPVGSSCPDVSSHDYHNLSEWRATTKQPIHTTSTPSEYANLTGGLVGSSCPDLTSHDYCNLNEWRTTTKQPIHTTSTPSEYGNIATGGPGDHAHLIGDIKRKIPEATRELIIKSLIQCNGDMNMTINNIKLYLLMDINLHGITRNKCQAALMQCNWDLQRAKKMIMDKNKVAS